MKKIILTLILKIIYSSAIFCHENVNADLDANLQKLNQSLLITNEKFSKSYFFLDSCNKSLIRCILLSTLLGLLILFTIIGNSFVIAAVFLDRNLHNVANYLIVSLAFADLTVAVMVMPIGAYQEVFREWSFGKILCDIWTIFDVLCCTASILHLVAIALDRYWAITKFGYGPSRTPRLIFTFIGIIWSVSLAVAVSPHIFGLSYDIKNTDRCHLTDHLTYQLVSTVAAFYLPLIGMCVIYWKIFRTAKLRIRKKAFKNGSLLPKGNKQPKCQRKNQSSNCKSSDHSIDSEEQNANKCSCENQSAKNDSTPNNKLDSKANRSLYLCEDSSFYDTKTACANGEYKALSAYLECIPTRDGDKQEQVNNDRLIIKKETLEISSKNCFTGSDKSFRRNVEPDQVSNILKKRAYIDLKRERKAAKTLGIIMSCFIACWLPYFLMQIFFSVCKNCYLTKKLENSYIVSILTWSGYLNSMLNPVIYTIFSPDFRNAFSRLLSTKYRL